MKKLLILLPLLAITSCSPDRVLFDELINKGTEENALFYYNDQPFNGVSFDVDEDGQLRYEGNIKGGKYEGLVQVWYENGQLWSEANFKGGHYDGLYQRWDEDGQLIEQVIYKNGVPID